MSLSTAYLTPKQRLIWQLKTRGKQEANIARDLNVTRQTIHKAIDTANTRIGESLTEAAKLNKVEIQTIDATKGFLSGYSHQFNTQAFVTFSAKNGIQVWYKHEGHCKNCKRLQQCRETLVAEANERKFLITDNISEVLPSKLADALFSRIIGELQMKRSKRLFDWCPQPQELHYGALRQHSKPIIALLTVSIIAASIIAASLAFTQSVTTAPLVIEQTRPQTSTPITTPTPTLSSMPTFSPTPTTKPTSTPPTTPNTNGQSTTYPTPSPTPTPIPTWHIETVDRGVHSSLALDSSDNPHLSYLDHHGGNLMYASWNGTGWKTQTIDKQTFNWNGHTGASSASVGSFASLALDSKGYPHISYYNYTNFNMIRQSNNSLVFGDLKYAWWNGVAWNTQTVDSGRVGDYCSLALDSHDQPFISYHEWNNFDGNLKCASLLGSAWKTETVDSIGDTGYYTSITVDSAGYPHISYLDNTNGNLKYASKDDTGWSILTVDHITSYTLGGAMHITVPYTSLAIDSTGKPHISYKAENPSATEGDGKLKYASWDGSKWVIQTVDSGVGSGGYSSLRLDSKDYPHISYLGYAPYGIASDGGTVYSSIMKYAEWNGTIWIVTTFDSENMVSGPSSLALDSAGYPHVSYDFGYNATLRYAYWG